MNIGDITSVAALVVGGVGLGGMWSSDRRQAAAEAAIDRQHTAGLAHANRTYDARRAAYSAASSMLERIRTTAQGINPVLVIGEPLPMPDQFTQEQWERMYGDLVVVRSAPTRDSVEEALIAFRSFQGAAILYSQMRLQDAAAAGLGKAGEQMESARAEVFAKIDAAEELMGRELDEL